MTSEVQIKSNKENSLKSTGPKDTSLTRFNAVRFGLTGKVYMTNEEIKAFDEVYQELQNDLKPNDIIDKVLVTRISKIIIRLQRMSQVESANIQNSFINARNWEKNPLSKIGFEEDEEPEIKFENISNLDLLSRYETSLENRLLKLLNTYYQRQGQC